MARTGKDPTIVAELGRPETPAETRARKATDTKLYRERKTVNNLVLSLIVSLGLVLVIVLIVPRGTGGFEDHTVDVQKLAEQAAPSAGQDLAAPEVPEGWKAKQAELRYSKADELTYWYIGYTTTDDRYAAVVQAFTADGSEVPERWVFDQLEQQEQTGTESLGGLEWAVYDHTDRDPDEANMLFGVATETDESTILVYGTDSPGELRALAATVAKDAK